MPTHAWARVFTIVFVAVLGCAPRAYAQPNAAAPAVDVARPQSLKLLLTTEAGLHGADMVTTVYDLRLGRNVRDGNPLLAPLSGRPAALVAVSSAANVLQVYTINKVSRRHPKLAVAWSLILIGTEAIAVTNNLRIAGRLRRESGAGR